MELTSVDQFGKDHWALLVYIETRAVNQQLLETERLRCSTKNRHLGGNIPRPGWMPHYGSCLRDGSVIQDHDDWDCLEDLEQNGFLIIGSQISGIVTLTDLGITTAHRIRRHKIEGGSFGTFVYSPDVEKKGEADGSQ